MSTTERAFNFDSISTKSILGADPAAGSNPAAKTTTVRTRVSAIRVRLVTDATAADRTLVLWISDGTTIFYYKAQAAQTASTTINYHFYPTPVETTTGTIRTQHLPEFDLPVGSVISVSFLSIQAGDDSTGVTYIVKEVP